MPVCNLIERSDNYSKTSQDLQQSSRDEPALDNNDNIADFTDDNNNTDLFKFEEKVKGQTGKLVQRMLK